jgi:hypothetical protein
VEREVLHPLCHDVENDLRLHTHTKTLEHMAALNPKYVHHALTHAAWILRAGVQAGPCIVIQRIDKPVHA